MHGRGARASGGTAPGVGRPAGPRLPPVVQRAGRRGTPAVQRLERHVTPAVQRLKRGGAARARRANLRARLPRGSVPDPARVRASRTAGVRGAPRAGPRKPFSGGPGRAPPGSARKPFSAPGGGPHSGSARAQAARCLRDSAGCLVPPRPSGRGGAGCPGPQCLSRPAPQRPSGGRRRLPSASAARRLGGSAGGVARAALPAERSSGAALQRRPCSVVRCRGRRRSSSTGGPLSGLGFALSGSPEGAPDPPTPSPRSRTTSGPSPWVSAEGEGVAWRTCPSAL